MRLVAANLTTRFYVGRADCPRRTSSASSGRCAVPSLRRRLRCWSWPRSCRPASSSWHCSRHPSRLPRAYGSPQTRQATNSWHEGRRRTLPRGRRCPAQQRRRLAVVTQRSRRKSRRQCTWRPLQTAQLRPRHSRLPRGLAERQMTPSTGCWTTRGWHHVTAGGQCCSIHVHEPQLNGVYIEVKAIRDVFKFQRLPSKHGDMSCAVWKVAIPHPCSSLCAAGQPSQPACARGIAARVPWLRRHVRLQQTALRALSCGCARCLAFILQQKLLVYEQQRALRYLGNCHFLS